MLAGQFLQCAPHHPLKQADTDAEVADVHEEGRIVAHLRRALPPYARAALRGKLTLRLCLLIGRQLWDLQLGSVQ